MAEFTPAEREIFRNSARIPTLEWVRKNLRLATGPQAGALYDPDVLPYAAGVFEAWDQPWVREIYFVAGSQSGKTQIAHGCLFSEIAQRPAPTAICMPDEDACARLSERRLHPSVRNSIALRRLLSRERDALQLHKIKFSTCGLDLLWVGSESRISTESYKILLLDEQDAYAKKTDAPTARERAKSYQYTYKIFNLSKPRGSEGESTIYDELNNRSQVINNLYARCPNKLCNHLQRMKFENIVVPDGERDPLKILDKRLARYRCEKCGWEWNDVMRDRALTLGGWVPDRDVARPSIVGFHLRSWEMPFVSLSRVIADWFAAQGDPDKLRAWRNDHAAEPYSLEPVSALADDLHQRLPAPEIERGVVPEWAVALTLAADMQARHFYFSVCAHGVDPRRDAIIDIGTLGTFEDLRQQIFEAEYPRENGGQPLGIWRASLDTGGGKNADEDATRTQQAYEWILRQPSGRVFGCKGMSRKIPGIAVRWTSNLKLPNGRKFPGAKLYLLDTDLFKRVVFARYEEDAEFPLQVFDGAEFDYFKQITAEKLIVDKNGREVWKKIRNDNHYLDCLVGHHALTHFQWTPSLAALAASLRRNQTARPAARPQPAANPYTGVNNFFGGR